MRICYFGVYDREYSRNRVIIKGLKANGIEVSECVSRVPGALGKFFDLIKKHRTIGAYNMMVVGFPGQQAMLLARLLCRKPLIFDAFTSQYDSVVNDRGFVSPYSPKAWLLWLSDWLACKLAGRILLDTEAHIDYFVKTFGIDRKKFICVRVGSDIETPSPAAKLGGEGFLVHFHGWGQRLQGFEFVIKAAGLLTGENIKFRIVSSNINEYYRGERPANVEFLDNVDFEKLAGLMAEADICLGIFGESGKAQYVIPNKVYEALACGRPVITADTPAIREIFEDRKHLLLCRIADPRDLADKILELKKNEGLRQVIAKSGLEYYLNDLTPDKVVSPLVIAMNGMRNRIVIYTAIFGGKDELLEPKYFPKNCDFICYTDHDFKSNVWQVRKVAPTNSDPVRAAKIYKILPHRYFPDYEFSVWIDGNKQVTGDVNELIAENLKESDLAAYDHMQERLPAARWDCIYDEAEYLYRLAKEGRPKEDPELIRRQVEHYRAAGYPAHNGLITAMVLVRRHNAPDLVKLMEDWWAEIGKWSRRDQLSFNYVAWKNGFKYAIIPGDCRKNKYFKHWYHKK